MPHKYVEKSATKKAPLILAALLSSPFAIANAQTSFAIDYTADLLSVVDGGIDTGTRYLDNTVISIENESTLSAAITLTTHASLLHANGSAITGDLVGDLQVVSSLESGFETTRLYEAWVDLATETVSVRAGLYDLNSEFDVLDSAGFFLNGSYGIGFDIGQSGPNGPAIFPFTAVGARLTVDTPFGALKIAAIDAEAGDPDDPEKVKPEFPGDQGALLIAELESSVQGVRVLTGAWTYSDDLPRVDFEDQNDASSGLYIRAEGELFQTKDAGPVMAFARAGIASSNTNLSDHYLSAGLVGPSPVEGRADDQVGVAFSYVGFGSEAKDVLGLTASELNIEASYAFQIGDRFAFQPNIQYIVDPGGDRSIDDTVVLGARFSWGWSQ